MNTREITPAPPPVVRPYPLAAVGEMPRCKVKTSAGIQYGIAFDYMVTLCRAFKFAPRIFGLGGSDEVLTAQSLQSPSC